MSHDNAVIEQPQTISPVADHDTGRFQVANYLDPTELRQLGNFVRETRNKVISADNEVERMFYQAALVSTMRDALELKGPYMKMLMGLQGSAAGFKTDKHDGYSEAIVRDIAIQATARGARMVFNEVNIISGGLYLTKECYWRLLHELPFVSGVAFDITTATCVETGKTAKGTKFGHALFTAWFSCKINGVQKMFRFEKQDDLDYRIVRKWYGTDTEDLLKGKAESKLFRIMYAHLSGEKLDDVVDQDLADDDNVIDVDEYTVRKAEVEVEPKTTEPEPEKAPEPEEKVNLAELCDRIQNALADQLAKCEAKRDVAAVEQKFLQRLSEYNLGGDETVIADLITCDCENRKEQITNSRGERSNG